MAHQENIRTVKKVVAVKRSERDKMGELVAELEQFEGLKIAPKGQRSHRLIIEAEPKIISLVSNKLGSKCHIEDLIEHK